MATYPRHKKARMIRDYMIEKDVIKMFKEEEQENVILFRTVYPMKGDNKPVVINVDDTPYVGTQILVAPEVPEEKKASILELINKFNLELPTVKYVLTADGGVVASMFFPADEAHFDAERIVRTTVEIMRVVSDKQYETLKAALL